MVIGPAAGLPKLNQCKVTLNGEPLAQTWITYEFH